MFKNWKTSLAGLFAGVAQAWAGGMDWKHIGLGVLTALVGFVAKDFNVTGGSVPQ